MRESERERSDFWGENMAEKYSGSNIVKACPFVATDGRTGEATMKNGK